MEEHEDVTFPCAQCGEPIIMQWAKSGGGLMRGDYELFGEVFFHLPCLAKYIAPLVEAQNS